MKFVYRLVAALLALAIIPSAYFLSFFYYSFDAGLLYVADEVYISDTVNSLSGNDSVIKDLLTGKSEILSSHGVEQIKPTLIIFVAFFALALILSLIIFFFALFSNKQGLITALAGGGLASMAGVYISFGHMAKMLTSGQIPLSSFFESQGLSFLLNLGIQLADSILGLKALRLTSATLIMTVLFAAIVIWGLAFILTDDSKEKVDKKAK
ncbi:MAG: hypothetical protein GX345_00810 [Clostridiales bacterium]|nr:hypothetical protein [Clostridiales bacterium]